MTQWSIERYLREGEGGKWSQLDRDCVTDKRTLSWRRSIHYRAEKRSRRVKRYEARRLFHGVYPRSTMLRINFNLIQLFVEIILLKNLQLLNMNQFEEDESLVIPRSRWPDRSDPWSDEFRAHTCSRCARITWSGKGFERTFVWTMVWDGLIRGSFKRTLAWPETNSSENFFIFFVLLTFVVSGNSQQ